MKSAEEFFQNVFENEGLQREIQGCDDADKFEAIISQSGYEFSREEWQAVLSSASEVVTSEEDLSEVAGGGHTQWTHCRVYDRGATHQGNTPCDRKHMHCI